MHTQRIGWICPVCEVVISPDIELHFCDKKLNKIEGRIEDMDEPNKSIFETLSREVEKGNLKIREISKEEVPPFKPPKRDLSKAAKPKKNYNLSSKPCSKCGKNLSWWMAKKGEMCSDCSGTKFGGGKKLKKSDAITNTTVKVCEICGEELNKYTAWRSKICSPCKNGYKPSKKKKEDLDDPANIPLDRECFACGDETDTYHLVRKNVFVCRDSQRLCTSSALKLPDVPESTRKKILGIYNDEDNG